MADSSCNTSNSRRLLCSFCSLSLTGIPSWFSHIRLVHSHEPGFFMRCSINGCALTYRNFSSLNTHVYRHHREAIIGRIHQQTITSGIECLADDNAPEREIFEHDDSTDDDQLVRTEIRQLLGIDSDEHKQRCALFLLEMKEKFGISQKAIDRVVSGSEMLLANSARRIEAGVSHVLSSNDVDVAQIPALREYFDNLQSPFVGISSSYLQLKYFKDNFGLIVS